MSKLFLKIFQMSIAASYVILVVLLLRLFLKRAPKKFSYLVWSVVAFRLICPFTVRSVFSIFNLALKKKNETVIDLTGVSAAPVSVSNDPYIVDTGVPIVSDTIQQVLEVSPSVPQIMEESSIVVAQDIAPIKNTVTAMDIVPWIWATGLILLLGYGILTYVKAKKEMEMSLPLRDNIRQAYIRTPFILGFIKPTIYIPFDLEPIIENVAVSHERHHIKRHDPLVKLLSYVLLCIHWFNPLCWLAYYEMGKDMEMSCDEFVLSHYREISKDYSTALLAFSSGHRFSLASPLAFGENNVKERILNAMRHRKASKIVSVLAAGICIVVLVACGTDSVLPDKGKDAELTLLADSFRTTPQWSQNDYQQKQAGEKLFVSFIETGGKNYFRIEDLTDKTSYQFEVDRSALWGDYFITDDYLLLFDQGTFFPSVSVSEMYAFLLEGTDVRKVELEEGLFFSSASGIVFDEINKDLYFVIEQQEQEDGVSSYPVQFYLVKYDLESGTVACIDNWKDRVIIADCDKNSILLRSKDEDFSVNAITDTSETKSILVNNRKDPETVYISVDSNRDSSTDQTGFTFVSLPVEKDRGGISRGYQVNVHTGFDFWDTYGAKIFAVADGVVDEVVYSEEGYGNYVILVHENGYRTLYAHCQEIMVSLNQKITAGQQIATMGSTGNSTGSHLHFELLDDDRISIDPYVYLVQLIPELKDTYHPSQVYGIQYLTTSSDSGACGLMRYSVYDEAASHTVVCYAFRAMEYWTYYLPELDTTNPPTMFMFEDKIYVISSLATYGGGNLTFSNGDNLVYVIDPRSDEIKTYNLDADVCFFNQGIEVVRRVQDNMIQLSGAHRENKNIGSYLLDLDTMTVSEGVINMGTAKMKGKVSDAEVRNYNQDGEWYGVFSGEMKSSGITRVHSLKRIDAETGETAEIIPDLYPFEDDWTIGTSPNFSLVGNTLYYTGVLYEKDLSGSIIAKETGNFYADLATGTIGKVTSERACPFTSYSGVELVFSVGDSYSAIVHELPPENTVMINRDDYIYGEGKEKQFQKSSRNSHSN